MRYREKSTRSKDRESPILTKTDKHTPTQNFSHHEEILLLLETKLILVFFFSHDSIKAFYCFLLITEISPFEPIRSVVSSV